MIKEILAQLVSGQSPTRDEAYAVMKSIMRGDCTDAQIAGYLTALRMHGETAEVIAGSVQAMREAFTPVATSAENVVDTCGTGGDGSNTFNISTASAFVAAGAGITVAKHGNKSVSSKCGSADVLGELGVNIGCGPEVMTRCLNDIGIAFLFAPALHPAMKHAIGPRKEMGIRTVFNILGPLSNPASAQRGVLGVYSAEIVPLVAEAAAQTGAKRLFVVHGNDGLDEITITTTTTVSEVVDGSVSSYELDPEAAGIPRAAHEDLVGGEAAENAEIIRDVLNGAAGPKRDIVVINAAAAIVASGAADDLKDGVLKAQQAIDSGAAKEKLDALVAGTAG